jgi:4-amino-4-deoxy-L-arabinose transferase-like glycosyltransferase
MKKTILVFVIILVVKLLLQYLLIDPAYDLHRDEFLHLDQGKHLAWGYISVPPVTSWISWLINLLGGSVFWVKFFPALFGTLTIVIVWKIIEELGGKTFASLLGILAVLLSVLLRINILYQPNSFDIFFWTLTYYTIIKYVNTNNSKWLYAIAFSIGFGFLSKYNIAFLVIGLFGGLVLTPERKIFLDKKLYIAMLIALIIILPNIIWQINNHFPTRHQLDELSRTQLVNVKRADFVKDQVMFFSNSIFIVVIAFIGFIVYPPFKKYRFVFLSFIIAISLYLFLKAKNYYAIGLYPVLIAFGSVYLEKLLSNGWKNYLKPIAVIVVLLLFAPIYLIAFPTKSPAEIEKNNKIYKQFGLLRWEDGKDHSLPQDFADMIGWSDLAKKVDSVYSQLPDKENTLVLCDNYGEAGAINYYSKFKNINAVSMNADYINWFKLNNPIKNVILIQEASDDDPGRTRERPWFDRIELTGMNDNPYSREEGTKIYLLQGAKVNINSILADEIQKRKKY